MEAAPSQRSVLWRQVRLMLWSSIATGMLLGLIAGVSQDNWSLSLEITLGAVAYAPAYILLFRFVLPRIRTPSRWRTLIGQTIAAILGMTCTSFLVVNAVLLARFGIWMLSQDASGRHVAEGAWPYFALPILPTAALAVSMFDQAWQPMRALEARAEKADELAASAQLQALHAQINPHFLFNSLNSIAHLITVDPVRAEECVQRLAEIFRYLLQSKDRTFVPLADELEIADGYLDIERARFGDQLRVEFDIAQDAQRWIVPTLIVQPLVENAVRHGISNKVGGGDIFVRARVEGRELVLNIQDSGVGMVTDGHRPTGATGVGLRNVSDRLTHLYGGSYLPEIRSNPGEGTHITLRVPDRALDAGGIADDEG
ncbi:MAG: histidine kinase [Candidatus Binatia bacterium]|nr:histidine kinase [Candidatus Binatia bacterium]